MSSPPTPLPDLTPQDAARLDALIAADLCLFTLAATTNTPLREVVIWADSPAIAPWLARLRDLHAAKLRQEMLAHLQSLVRNSPDPIESRRAATAVLKHLSGARPKRRPAPTEAHGSDPWTPTSKDRRAEPPIPAPAATPDPALTPRDVADAILAAVRQPDRALTASTLAAFATPQASINSTRLIPTPNTDAPRAILAANHPALQLLSTASASLPTTDPHITPHPFNPSDRTTTLSADATLADGTTHRLTLTLDSRAHLTPPNAWRLAILTLSPHTGPSG